MKKLIIVMAALAATAQVLAMPTRAELSKAQPLVVELMAPTMGEYKSATDKTAAAVVVGDRSCAFAAEAETEAVKFLLLKGAVNYYVRGEAYDKAADCIAAMQADIGNLTPDVVAEIVGKATSRISEAKAPRLIAYYRAAKLQIRAKNEIPVLEKKLKRVKTEQLQRQYAEALAISGNWKAAYDAFAKVRDKDLARIAEAESKGTVANEQAAELWWNYKPEFEGAGDFFKAHAVEFYQKALDNGEITGLKKNVVERRIAQLSETASALAVTQATKGATVASKWTIPANFKDSLVRTLKLSDDVNMDFCACPAGTFQMSHVPGQEPRSHKVTITRPFWISRQFVTSRQNRAVGGNPVDDDVAQKLEKMFPENDIVLKVHGSVIYAFINAMNERFGAGLPQGYVFRLPTEAELEYAVRAGGKFDGGELYKDKFHTRRALASKGLLSEEEKKAKGLPKIYASFLIHERISVNPWKIIGGMTDTAQLTLDSVDVPKSAGWDGNPKENLVYAAEEVDPFRIGNRRLKRQWNIGRWLTTGIKDDIFRVVIGPDLVAEKMAKNGKK